MNTASGITLSFFLLAPTLMLAQDPDTLATQDTTRVDTVVQQVRPTAQDEAELRARDSTHMAFATKDEGAWIGIRGRVVKSGERSFLLEHEDGTLGVAMGGQELRDQSFEEGRTVTVYGRVDKDFFASKVIKARAVRIHGEGEQATQHQVIGEGDAVRMLSTSAAPGTVVHGRVTGIEGRKVTLEQEDGHLIVDTSTLSYDPMQAQPHMRVERGDRVTAQGAIRGELWSGRTLKATALDVVKMGQHEQEGGENGSDAPVQEEGVEGALQQE